MLSKELRVILRQRRALAWLAVSATLLTLVSCAIGSALGMWRAPLLAGPVYFQAFFSMAYLAVGFLAPLIGAVTVASEKDAQTWETLLLTSLPRQKIAVGKYLASLALLAWLIVLIAPAGLLGPLSGGVPLLEVLVAFALLALIAGVGAAYGIAVGVRSQGLVSAVFTALVSALSVVPALYFAVGIGFSFFAHATWPGVPLGAPVWLPSAYVRARFDVWYFVLLLFVPLAVSVLAIWFCYELAVARLATESDDRTTGRKRWYLVALPTVAAIAAIPGWMTRGPSRLLAFLCGLGGLFLFVVFAAYLFVGDALDASPRVQFRWQQRGASYASRLFGPGLVQTSMLVMVSSLGMLGLFALGGALVLWGSPLWSGPPPASVALLCCAEIWSAFLVFIVGFLLWARVRASSASTARALGTFACVAAAALPFVGSLIFDYLLGKRVQDVMLMAAPSPLYAFSVMRAIERGEPHLALMSGFACSAGWIGLGLFLFALGARRATRLVAEQRRRAAELRQMC